jgi:glycosyltransferase involved in cell wall biosynthesis/uncharacterized membrane protein
MGKSLQLGAVCSSDAGVTQKPMKTMPLVSIIIPTRNCAGTIERCLQSVRAQTYPNIEIIVVDNFSTDGTVEIAERFARVLQVGPERSVQFNAGAHEAKGKYLYRIDGDFELAPGIVAACMDTIEQGGFDSVAVVNRSTGDSFWAQVRKLERDTYQDDPLIVAARFWKCSIFEAVGGFDETLVACEDYDLHNRLVLKGYKIGRVNMEETHLGEAGNLWAYASQSFYYGPSALSYVRKHPRRGAAQMFPLRASYLRHWRSLIRQPKLFLGLVVLKIVQYCSAAAGILVDWAGLRDSSGRLFSGGITYLALVMLALLGLVSVLPGLGLSRNGLLRLITFGGGFLLWQLVGRRRARLKHKDLFKTLSEAALAYCPLLVLLLVGPFGVGSISRQTWEFLSSGMISLWISLLVYLAEPLSDEQLNWRKVPLLTAATIGIFVLWLSWRSLALLKTYSFSAFDLAVYDQGLWNSVNGSVSRGSWLGVMYTSIEGQSFFAHIPAPILLVFLPFYALGLGGPGLLLVSQVVAIGLGGFALYRLASDEIRRWPAMLLTAAFLFYYVSLRIGNGNFQVMVFAIPLLLFALHAFKRRRFLVFYVLVVLALACGVDASLAVAGLGLYLALFSSDRRHGLFALVAGLLWTWVVISVFEPFFGGAIGQELVSYLPSQHTPFGSHLVSRIFRPEVLQYLGELLSPISFAPLLDAPALIPALPRLVLNFLGDNPRYLSLNGWYEFTILPFLFAAIASGSGKLDRIFRRHGWAPLEFAGSLLILSGCLSLSAILTPGLLSMTIPKLSAHQRLGGEIMAQIPATASVAAQDPFAISLSHRRQLTLLPQIQDADFLLLDVYHPDRGPHPETYSDLLQAVFRSPDYGLRIVDNGYLLFERGLNPADKLRKLALVTDFQIQYPHPAELSDSITYMGYDLSTEHPLPGETFYITHFWKCLKSTQIPYWLFLGYPGARLFDEFAFGLYGTDMWQAGDIVRQEQMITLPELPDGDQYEVAVGLWHDSGVPELRSAQQLLGNDVIRIARIIVRNRNYSVIPWASVSSPGARP